MVASIPTDREDPSGLAGWQSCKGLMAKEQLVVSLWIHPGNFGEELHCCCRNPSIHPQAWWHFLTAPATEHPLSVVSPFDGNSNFVAKLVSPVFGSSVNHGGHKLANFRWEATEHKMGSGIDDRWWLCQGSDNATSCSNVLKFNPCCDANSCDQLQGAETWSTADP